MTVAEELAREFYAWAESAADRIPEASREATAICKLSEVLTMAYDRGCADTRARLLDDINKKIASVQLVGSGRIRVDGTMVGSEHVVHKVAALADLRSQIEKRS